MTKAKALFSARQRLVPQHGEISGGLLDGWSYGLVGVVIVKGQLYLDVRCTRPKWVFPKVVRLRMADYVELRNPGMVAPTHEMQKLIDAAEAAGKNK